MLKVLQIFNFLKKFGVVLVPLVLLSCENNPANVTEGEAQTTTEVVSGSCSAGSFTVFRTVTPGTASSKLQLGEEVTISGTVNDGSPCRSGSVTFSCAGRYKLPENQIFSCETGTISSAFASNFSSSSYTTSSHPYPAAPNPYAAAGTLPSSNTILSGSVHILGNGTKSAVSIVIANPSQLRPHDTCTIGFNCM